MSDQDQLKKERMFTEYKMACNKVKNLVRNAKKLYFRRLVENNKDILALSEHFH